MIRYDMLNGILKRKTWLFVPVVVFGMCIFYVLSLVRFAEDATFGACFAQLLEGKLPSGTSLSSSGFPPYWIFIQLGCLYFTLEYPMRDMNIFGRQIMLRCKSRVKWWLSKCLWNAVSVLIYWAIGILIIAAFCQIFNVGLDLGVNKAAIDSILSFPNVEFGYYTSKEMVPILLIIPYLSILSVNLFQMLVGLLTNRIIGLISGIALLCVSLMYMSPFAVGNYSMMQRCSMFYTAGLSFNTGIYYVLLHIFVIVMLGAWAIKRIDILEPSAMNK